MIPSTLYPLDDLQRNQMSKLLGALSSKTVDFDSALYQLSNNLENLYMHPTLIRDIFKGNDLHKGYSTFIDHRLMLAEHTAWRERPLRQHNLVEWSHRQVLDRTKQERGGRHPDTLTSMNNLALVLNDLGKHAEAERLHRETLILREQVLGGEHVSTLASRNNLALALSGQKKYAEAEQMHRDTLDRRVAAFGREHLATLISLHNLAQALSRQGGYGEALPLYKQSCTAFCAILGLDDPITQACVDHYRYVQRATGTAASAALAEH